MAPFLCDRLVVWHPPPVTLGPCMLSAVEASRSCAVPKHDWIRKTFTYILIELKSLDEVTAAGFQTRSCHFQNFQVAGISCADRCIRAKEGARASPQAAVTHKCGVLPMLCVSADPAYSVRHRCELSSPSPSLPGEKNKKPHLEKTSA